MQVPSRAAVIIFLTASLVLAAAPPIEWMRTYPELGVTFGQWVEQTLDGGYVIVGQTMPGRHEISFLLLKTDSLGVLQWHVTFDSGNPVGSSRPLVLARDGGYVLTGDSRSAAGAYVVKTDGNGRRQWERTFLDDSFDQLAYSSAQTDDGGYVVSGFAYKRAAEYLMKLDSSGNVIWKKHFPGGYSNGSYHHGAPASVPLAITSDAGFVFAARKDTIGLRLVKTDTLGNPLWESTFKGQRLEEGVSICQTIDSGYVVTGACFPPNEDHHHVGDIYVLKTDALGQMRWLRRFGGLTTGFSESIRPTDDGGYVVAVLPSDKTRTDGLVFKTDSAGNAVWSGHFGTTDWASCIQPTTDGGYVVTGTQGIHDLFSGSLYLTKLKPEPRK